MGQALYKGDYFGYDTKSLSMCHWKDPRISINPLELSDEDTLNGVTYRAEVVVNSKAFRRFTTKWSDWSDLVTVIALCEVRYRGGWGFPIDAFEDKTVGTIGGFLVAGGDVRAPTVEQIKGLLGENPMRTEADIWRQQVARKGNLPDPAALRPGMIAELRERITEYDQSDWARVSADVIKELTSEQVRSLGNPNILGKKLLLMTDDQLGAFSEQQKNLLPFAVILRLAREGRLEAFNPGWPILAQLSPFEVDKLLEIENRKYLNLLIKTFGERGARWAVEPESAYHNRGNYDYLRTTRPTEVSYPMLLNCRAHLSKLPTEVIAMLKPGNVLYESIERRIVSRESDQFDAAELLRAIKRL